MMLSSDDFPTLSQVGEANVRAYLKRKAAQVFGEPVDYFYNYLESKHERGE